MRSISIFFGLIACFLIPWIFATTLFEQYRQDPSSVAPMLSAGIFFQPGTQISSAPPHSGMWSLLCIRPPQSGDRWELWQQQAQIFPSFLKGQNLQINITETQALSTDDLNLISHELPWDLPEDGGAILLDPHGFAALAFPYHNSPKEAFFAIRKLVSS